MVAGEIHRRMWLRWWMFQRAFCSPTSWGRSLRPVVRTTSPAVTSGPRSTRSPSATASVSGYTSSDWARTVGDDNGATGYVPAVYFSGAENYWPWGLSVGDLNADGFDVLPYTTEDLSVAERLAAAGCEVLMPWVLP